MRIDELLDAAPPPSPDNAIKIAAFMDFFVEAEDMDPGERSALISGYLMGMTYMLARAQSSEVEQGARDLLRQQSTWQARGWI